MNIKEVLKKHKNWLLGKNDGEKADLRWADLCGADLCGADLCGADLYGADLSEADLCEANLRRADLCRANLCGANLYGANLCEANLRRANLRGANLSEADLCGADLDFSSGISFGCGSFDFKADIRLAAQLAYHFCRIDFGSCKDAKEAQTALKVLANKTHLIPEHNVRVLE